MRRTSKQWGAAVAAAAVIALSGAALADPPAPGNADARPDPGANNPQPPYPDAAQVNGEQGTVVLNVRVSYTGRVRAVEVVGSSGFPDLDNAAAEGVMAWHFIPALRDGDTATTWTTVKIRYQLPTPALAAPTKSP